MTGPKAIEVCGYLHGTLVRCPKMQKDGNKTVGERRCLRETEEVLKVGGDVRRLVHLIVHDGCATESDFHALWSQCVDGLHHGVTYMVAN